MYIAKIVKKGTNQPELYYCHTDPLGTIKALTDTNGQVVKTFEHEPFDRESMETGALEDESCFTGKRLYSTSLYYFNARYYDPTIGRFISADPARQGLNGYVYCSNSPLMFVNPDGMEKSMIDPGHRGDDPGAVSLNKLYYEKDYALDTALKLGVLLEEAGHTVYFTRIGDLNVILKSRADFPNDNDVDIFVSIHFNAHEDTTAQGFEVVVYKLGTDSARLAKSIESYAIAEGYNVRETKPSNKLVVRETKMQAIIVEAGFMTNDHVLKYY